MIRLNHPALGLRRQVGQLWARSHSESGISRSQSGNSTSNLGSDKKKSSKMRSKKGSNKVSYKFEGSISSASSDASEEESRERLQKTQTVGPTQQSRGIRTTVSPVWLSAGLSSS